MSSDRGRAGSHRSNGGNEGLESNRLLNGSNRLLNGSSDSEPDSNREAVGDDLTSTASRAIELSFAGAGSDSGTGLRVGTAIPLDTTPVSNDATP